MCAGRSSVTRRDAAGFIINFIFQLEPKDRLGPVRKVICQGVGIMAEPKPAADVPSGQLSAKRKRPPRSFDCSLARLRGGIPAGIFLEGRMSDLHSWWDLHFIALSSHPNILQRSPLLSYLRL